MKDNIFLVLGGDKRSLYLGEHLEKQGFDVKYYGFKSIDCYNSLDEALKKAKIVILPLPLSRDNVTLNAPYFDKTILLSSICEKLNNSSIIFGGKLSKDFCKKLDSKNIFYNDYFLSQELAIYNSIPTSEGTIGILIENLPITIHKMNIGILGYGKVSKVLAKNLNSLGANVTIFARKEKALAEAYSQNLNAKNFELLKTQSQNFDALINTVPEKVLGKNELKNFNSDCLLIELASPPFGINFQSAEELAFKVIKASALPGKVAPKTAGEIIGRSILPIINARGFLN